LAEGSDAAVVHIGPVPMPVGDGNACISILGGTVLEWQVEPDSDGPDLLRGRRSAWEAADPAEVQIWASSAVPEGSTNKARLRVTSWETGAPADGASAALATGLVAAWDYDISFEEADAGQTAPTGVWTGQFQSGVGGPLPLFGLARQGPYWSYAGVSVGTWKGQTRVLLTTDKPLYQPGQVMHMRAMALVAPSNVPAGGKDAEFIVVDPAGNKLARIETKTNAYGVASAQFKLGSKVQLGAYDLVVEIAGVQAARAVKVSRYTLPKFKVDVDLEKSWFLAGDTVEGVVRAHYLFGKPVAGGQVLVTTLMADGESPGPFAVTGQTDAEGYFEFSAKLPDDIQKYLEGADGTVYLAVRVVDTADQDQEALLKLRLTTSPVRVYLVPEAEPLLVGVEQYFYLVTTGPTGEPMPSVGTVTAKSGEEIPVETDAEGVGVFVHAAEQGETLEVEATAGEWTGTGTFGFLTAEASGAAVVRTDRAVYEVGDSVAVTVLTGAPAGVVYLDVTRAGQTLAMEAGALEDGTAAFEVPVADGYDGELTLTATVLPDGTDATVGAQRTVFVHRHKELRLELAADKPSYAPGDSLTLAVSTRDENDKPLQAAVGLTVVDEALYAIQDAKPGLLWKVFEAGGAIADPTFHEAFPAIDLVGLLGAALPEAGEQMEHFQRLAAAALAAVETLDVYAATASGGKAQYDRAINLSRGLVYTSISQIQGVLLQEFQQGGWSFAALAAYVAGHQWADPWGRAYEVEADEYGYVLFRSAGMDELFGTADDAALPLNRCDFDEDYCMYDVAPMDSSSWAEVGIPEDSYPTGDAGGGEEPLASGGKPVKVRSWFPETLYVDPAVITDEQGKASVEVPLADSITQWRATALGSSMNGRLGSAAHGITVFQDFFVDPDLPTTYTRGDEVKFPVAVYNYLDEEQSVTVSLKQEPWFVPLAGVTQSITMPAGSVDAVYFSVRVDKAGWHTLTVEASGALAADAVARPVDVLPGGKQICQTESGATPDGGSGTLELPDATIEGSVRSQIKLYANGMVHVLEGVDSLLQLPYG
jgi:hypothetical protein